MPKPKWMAKGGMGKRAKAAALAITAPATPKLSWKVKKENMQYEYEPQGGSNIDMLKMRRAAKGAGPIEDKTREFIMGVCSAMGRYEDVMGRIFTNFRKYYRTPKVAFTESRIAQVASETRSMQRCQVLAQKYHAHRVLSVCLKQLSSEGAWQTLQKPRGQESLGLTVRRFKFEPLLRDETSCFIYLLNTIDTVLRINSEREFEVLPQDVVANPAKIAKMLQLARKRAMSAAVLNAELCVDRIERHMVLNRADWARKVRSALTAARIKPNMPKKEKTRLLKYISSISFEYKPDSFPPCAYTSTSEVSSEDSTPEKTLPQRRNSTPEKTLPQRRRTLHRGRKT